MALGKLLKGGSLVLAGALVGGLLSYNSKKTEIVAGINDISNMAIEYKTQAKELSTNKENLEESITVLETQIENLTTELEQLINENELLELSYSRTYTKTEKMYINSMDFALGKISYDEFMAQVMKINND